MPSWQMGAGELPGASSHCVRREPRPAPAPSQLGPNAFSFLETTTVLRTAGAVWGGLPEAGTTQSPAPPDLEKTQSTYRKDSLALGARAESQSCSLLSQ